MHMRLRNIFAKRNKQKEPEQAIGKKYELLPDKTKMIGERKLYRIRALRDFRGVKAGERGGFVESERNLSHEGKCWVGNNAQVFDEAVVSGDARVYENAMVFDAARVSGKARVYASARVCCFAMVAGEEKVTGYRNRGTLTWGDRFFLWHQGIDY